VVLVSWPQFATLDSSVVEGELGDGRVVAVALHVAAGDQLIVIGDDFDGERGGGGVDEHAGEVTGCEAAGEFESVHAAVAASEVPGSIHVSLLAGGLRSHA
jgi:hypothetical protein